jgi:hypothetical protein
MRNLVLALVFLAVPTLVVAQQADPATDLTVPTVELQQSTPATPAATDAAGAEPADQAPVDAQSETVTTDAAVMQDPTQPRWWWLVGAIVVAGIILAVIL